jgi:FlaA1/EpsC-like NDP-sugar epimerase
MDRLRAPVLRHRLLQIAADAALAALAFYLAFRLRFLDTPNGIPARYEEMLLGAIAFVALGKALLFSLAGIHQKWWRYFTLGDTWAILRVSAVATALLLAVFTLAKPFPDSLPRSVLILDFLFTVGLLVSARGLARFVREELPLRRRRRDGAGSVLVVGAGSGGQMVVRELLLNPSLGRPVGFVDDDPNKRGTRPAAGLKVLGTTEQMDEVLDEVDPDEVIIAIPSSSCCAGACSSPARSERSRSRTCSAANP